MRKKAFLRTTITILCVMLLLAGCGRSTAATLAKKLELGQKYLEELSCEQAVAVFEEAIAIDPKAWDAYVGLASAYKGLGDLGQAAAALERGMEEAAEADKLSQESVDFLVEIYKQQIEEFKAQGMQGTVDEIKEKIRVIRPEELSAIEESAATEETAEQRKPVQTTQQEVASIVEDDFEDDTKNDSKSSWKKQLIVDPKEIPFFPMMNDPTGSDYDWFTFIKLYLGEDDQPEYVYLNFDDGVYIWIDNIAYDTYLEWLEAFQEWLANDEVYMGSYYKYRTDTFLYPEWVSHADGTEEEAGGRKQKSKRIDEYVVTETE